MDMHPFYVKHGSYHCYNPEPTFIKFIENIEENDPALLSLLTEKNGHDIYLQKIQKEIIEDYK
jgi:hypothetical protein